MGRAYNRCALAAMLMAFAPTMASAASCTAGASGVAFGLYNPLSSSANTSTGSVTVTCAGVGLLYSYTITLSAGAGSYAQRQLTGTATPLNYNLYTNAGMTSIWGDGTAGTSTVTDSYVLTLGNAAKSYPLYANMPALQNVAAGAYSDSIIVTVSY